MPIKFRIALYIFAVVGFGIGWLLHRNNKDGFRRLMVLLMVLATMLSTILRFIGVNSGLSYFLFTFIVLVPVAVYHKHGKTNL